MNKPSEIEFDREVDEDLKREYYAKLWQKYGAWVLGAALLFVASVAGFQIWTGWRATREAADGARFLAAIQLADGGQPDKAVEAFAALARDGTAGYATLARLEQAALLGKKPDQAAAVQDLYAQVAKGGADSALRDLALLLGVLHRMDDADPGQLTAVLAPLTGPENPWRFTALELTALLAQRAGHADQARDVYTKLADDPAAPAALRARAAQMRVVLGG